MTSTYYGFKQALSCVRRRATAIATIAIPSTSIIASSCGSLVGSGVVPISTIRIALFCSCARIAIVAAAIVDVRVSASIAIVGVRILTVVTGVVVVGVGVVVRSVGRIISRGCVVSSVGDLPERQLVRLLIN